MYTRVLEEARMISRSESRSSRRLFGGDSSKPSIYINTCGNDAIAFFRISSISESRSPWQPNFFLAFWKVLRTCSGIPPSVNKLLEHGTQYVGGGLFLLGKEITV